MGTQPQSLSSGVLISINQIRTKVRLTALKTIVIGIRGYRKRSVKYQTTPTNLLSFDIIPEMNINECIIFEINCFARLRGGMNIFEL